MINGQVAFLYLEGAVGNRQSLLEAMMYCQLFRIFCLINGQVAQSVEQGTENPCVGGSIPPLATIVINIISDSNYSHNLKQLSLLAVLLAVNGVVNSKMVTVEGLEPNMDMLIGMDIITQGEVKIKTDNRNYN